MRVRFTVPGLPVPQGSKRVVRGRLIDANGATLRPYRALVADAAAQALGGALSAHEPTREPVSVSVRFVLPRPRGHYGTGRNAGVLKASAPLWPTTKPDVDKLCRAVLDALTAVVWVDDSQVVVLDADKMYGASPATVVVVQWPPVVPLDVGE
jgi:crossover junction endodeoxyribonuclease RusA